MLVHKQRQLKYTAYCIFFKTIACLFCFLNSKKKRTETTILVYLEMTICFAIVFSSRPNQAV